MPPTKTSKRKVVEPRLNGLLVREPNQSDGTVATTLYPWMNVGYVPGQHGSLWTVYDESGQPVRLGFLKKTLRTADPHVSTLARRAQVRAFKQA